MHRIMKRYKYIIGLLLLLISFMVSAQQELENYLLTAAENNPGLQAKFNEYMAALEVAPQVNTLPDPQVAFAYFISPVETRVGPQQFKFSASQMFPWFGTLQTKENVANQAAKAKYEVFLESKSRLFNEVRSTYFNIYFNKRAIEITRENLDILGTFQKLANIKVEAGKVSAVDEYRIEMEIGDLENRLALLMDKQNVFEVMFINLLNVDDDLEIQTPSVLWTNDISVGKEQALDTIRSNNHQLLVLSLQQEVLSYRKELAETQGKPNFSVGFDYTAIGQGSNNLAGTDAFAFPKVGITIPLYRSKYRAMVNEVVYLQAAKESELSDKENLLETILENAWKEYLDSDRRISLYQVQLTLANQSLTLLETEYSTGNKNFEEILRMERKFLSYGLELEKARSDKQAAISFINYLMGK
jgi:cobalt-zinc-cadmium efflux system outer membrane protein